MELNNLWFYTASTVPITVNVSYFGAKYIDNFIWNLSTEYSTVDEFSWQTCQDMNLPNGFRHRIALQIIEQLDSYKDLLMSAKFCAQGNSDFLDKFKKPLEIDVSICKELIEYNDRILWNLYPISSFVKDACCVELFAQTTIADLGLPLEIEPILIFKIYEALYQHLIQSVENQISSSMSLSTNAQKSNDVQDLSSTDFQDKCDSKNEVTTTTVSPRTVVKDQSTESKNIEDFPSVKLLNQNDFMSIIVDSWKHEKPSEPLTVMVPYALIPDNKFTNAHVWKT